MAQERDDDAVRAGLTEAEMRERVVQLVFGGDPRRLEEFCEAIRQGIPAHGRPAREHPGHAGLDHVRARANWTEQRRVRELRAILQGIARHQDGFHVVVGDFNTLAPGEALDLRKLPPRLRAVVWLTGRQIRWETIQVMLDASYVDGYRSLHPGDPGYTLPTWDPHVRLDYVFLPFAWSPRLTACTVASGHPAMPNASDHMPLLAEVEPA